jgi:hypothetical protein
MEKTLEMPIEDRLLTADVRIEGFVKQIDGFLKSDLSDEDKLIEIQIANSRMKLLMVIDPLTEDTGA